MRKIIGKKNKVHYVEETTRFQMVKSHKGWLVIGASMFALGLGMLVTSRPVSADVAATSTSISAVNADSTSANNSSAVNAETTSASSSSATNADSTIANNSSAVNAETTSASSSSATNAETTGSSSSSATNAETTGASSSSATNADSTSANNSSAVNAETTSASSSSATDAETTSASSSSATDAETTGASSSSAVNADSTIANNSSAVNAETTSASSSSEMKADSTSTSSSSAVKADVTSADGKQRVAQIATNDSKNSAIVTTKFAQNYGRKVLAGSVTNTGFSVSDPNYPSGMWIDPDNSHYSYRWVQAKYGGKYGGTQIVFSTNRTGDGIVYVTELSESNKILKQYTLNQNTQVTSAVFDSTTYYNDAYFEMVRSSNNSFVTKYTASKFDSNYYNTLSYFVPKLITQTTYYVDKDGKQITDSNGNPVVAYTQKGLVGQNYTTSDVTVVNGYYATAPSNSNGVMSPYGEIGASYVKNFHDGVVITYTQTGSDGTMSASIAQNGSVLKTWTSIKPSDSTIMYRLGSATYGIKNPYIPQTSDIKYVYNKLGNWIVYNPDGSTTSRIYPNDPSNPTKIADSSVPDYPVIAFIPGYIAKDHMGTPLVPVDPDDRTKGYIPPTPSDNGTDTTITYTADQQEGSVSYVDDTTGKTLKTDSISGTTGSKSSYS
ncbi:mucus binding protein, partial [Lactococcus garvieae]